MLTDKLTARDFSEPELDYEIAELLYMAYAVNDENYAKIVNGFSNYSVPLIDILCSFTTRWTRAMSRLTMN